MYDVGQFLTHTWQHSSNLVEDCLILLLAMLLWMLADHGRRGYGFLAASWQSRRFLRAGAGLLEQGAWADVWALAERFQRGPVAIVYAKGLRGFGTEHECAITKQSVDAATREARLARNRVREQLRQGLNGMATISTTAPLVGLFATTIGILDSFGGYIGPSSSYESFLAANTAKALVPTAAGLFVGVLATWSYNWRSNRLATCNAEMDIASSGLVKYLERQRRNAMQ
jgi:biopolymer transport protein ExbB/TolQ